MDRTEVYKKISEIIRDCSLEVKKENEDRLHHFVNEKILPSELRGLAIIKLSNFKTSQTSEFLLSRIPEEPPDIQEKIFWTLGNIGDRSTASKLIEYLNYSNLLPPVKMSIVLSLKMLGLEEMVNPIINQMKMKLIPPNLIKRRAKKLGLLEFTNIANGIMLPVFLNPDNELITRILKTLSFNAQYDFQIIDFTDTRDLKINSFLELCESIKKQLSFHNKIGFIITDAKIMQALKTRELLHFMPVFSTRREALMKMKHNH